MQVSSFRRYLNLALDRYCKKSDSYKAEAKTYSENRNASHSARRWQFEPYIRPRFYRNNKTYEKETEAEHRANERSLKDSTKKISDFTIVLAVVGALSAIFSALQWRAISGQLDAMQADQRPWIKVEVFPGRLEVDRLPTDKDGPVIFFFPHLKMTNIGKSPAFNATFSFDTYVAGEGHNDPHSAQRELCKKIRDPNNPDSLERKPNGIPRDYISALGAVLFPGDFFTESHEYGVRMVGIIGEKVIRYMQKPKDKYYVHFFLIGCVDYIFGTPAQHHQTGFVYAVSQVDGDTITPFFDASENVPESKIRISPSQSSSIAD